MFLTFLSLHEIGMSSAAEFQDNFSSTGWLIYATTINLDFYILKPTMSIWDVTSSGKKSRIWVNQVRVLWGLVFCYLMGYFSNKASSIFPNDPFHYFDSYWCKTNGFLLLPFLRVENMLAALNPVGHAYACINWLYTILWKLYLLEYNIPMFHQTMIRKGTTFCKVQHCMMMHQKLLKVCESFSVWTLIPSHLFCGCKVILIIYSFWQVIRAFFKLMHTSKLLGWIILPSVTGTTGIPTFKPK